MDSAFVIIDETSRFHIGSNPGRSLTLASISSGLHRLCFQLTCHCLHNVRSEYIFFSVRYDTGLISPSLSLTWQLVFYTLCLNRCFGKKGQPVSSLFHIPTGFAHNAGHAVGLRPSQQIVKQSAGIVYREGKHGGTDIHTRKTTPFAAMIWQEWIWFIISMPRVMWSIVRLTKWPNTIGIRFVTALHSLPVGWPQEQGTHITTVSWLRVIMTRFWNEVTIITTSCYFTMILL